MLIESGLLKSFWMYVMDMSAFLTGRSLTTGLHGKTPYEKLFK